MPVHRAPHVLRNRLVIVLGLLCLGLGAAVADDTPRSASDLPAVFSKQVPEGPKDLREIQKHVQALVKKLQPATVGLRIGQAQGSGVIINKEGLVRTDCALVGGDSGGPLFDMRGKVIGIHSRIGPFITTNIHVPVDTYRETWDKLAASEDWGSGFLGGAKQADVYMGVMIEFENK